MKNIVTANWLKENINNENLVIVDCRFDLMNKLYGKESYENEHIKGAVRLDIETDLSSIATEHGGRHPLPSIEELKNTFENIGISNDSIVVTYDNGDMAGPCRLWWILRYLGHEKVYVLNEGISAFKEIGGEVTKEITHLKKGKFDININEDMAVDMKYVRERLHNKNVGIIDSRENRRYIGEFEPVDKKAGRIPSALNYFWMNILNIDEEKISLKSITDLDKNFYDLKNYDEVIIYCGSGITACPNSLALSEIGIKHKVYPGSFSDWISYDDNDIETN